MKDETVSVGGSGGGVAGGTVDFRTEMDVPSLRETSIAPIAGCTTVQFQNGAAVCTTSFSTTGTLTIGASYSGDANNPGAHDTTQLTVAKASSLVTVSAAPVAPNYGGYVTLSASVTGSPGAP